MQPTLQMDVGSKYGGIKPQGKLSLGLNIKKKISFAVKWKIEKRPCHCCLCSGFDCDVFTVGGAVFLSAVFEEQ